MPVTEREFNPSGSEAVDAIKAKALELEEVILEAAPNTLRAQHALMFLETASMWAVKAAVRGDE